MLEEEKTDSESSCLLFEKEKRLSERMNFVCRKYALRPLGGTALFYLSDVFPFHSGDLHLVCG